MSILHRLRLRLRALFGRDAINRDLEEELHLHIDLQTEENIRAGISPEEARRRAMVQFGGMEGHKDASRRAQGLELMGATSSWLDFKLGIRMLLKYPGLTLVGGLALTVATGLGAAFFQFSENMFTIRLPFEDADRMVTIENRDVEAARTEDRAFADFLRWREELGSVEDVSAVQTVGQTFTTEDGYSERFEVARTSASAFEIVRAQPLLGRLILPEDERPGAAPVVVIGYTLWQRIYDGDRTVVGRTARVGATTATIVGVMPEGFGFPVNHSVWTPLQVEGVQHGPLEGPSIKVMGRLRPDVSLEEAQAEIAAIGARTAADFPQTHERIQPRVRRFSDVLGGNEDMRWAVQGIRFGFVILMIIMCVNVATLVFARTAARENEFAVRSALGASRRRIVMQLFLEALALTLTAAGIGLFAAWWGLRWGMDLFWKVQGAEAPPFWFSDALFPATVVYVLVLAVVGAAMVGIVPALKVTGKRVQPTLSQMSAGNPRLRFGGIWTVIVVLQVALSVAFLPTAIMAGKEGLKDAERGTDFRADDYLVGQLTREMETAPEELPQSERPAVLARSVELTDEVKRRVEAEPGVDAVTFATALAGMNHVYEIIHIHDNVVAVPSDTSAGPKARSLGVDRDYFDAMRAPIVSGRAFGANDVASGGSVIVNQSFVRNLMAGQDPVGHRIRYPRRGEPEDQRWYEVVGVVRDLDMDAYGPGLHSAIYHTIRPEQATSLQMFVVGSQVQTLGPGIRTTINTIDPTLRLGPLATVGDAWGPVHQSDRFFAAMHGVVALVALLLSMAGIHALMSFTVSRRTREIGIRAALGAHPIRIVGVIFSRAFIQLGIGVVIGATFAMVMMWDDLGTEGPGVLIAVVATMLAVGLIACYLPARRALAVHPTEALRSAG